MKILSLSVLPLGWDKKLNTGMPSVQLAIEGYVNLCHQVKYITLGNRSESDSLYDGLLKIVYLKEPHRPIQRRIIYSLSQWHYSLLVWKRLFEAAEKAIQEDTPDVIIGNTFYGAVPAYYLAKKYHIPYIFREFGTMELTSIVTCGSLIKRIGKWCEIKAYKLPAQAFIFTDDGSRTDVAAKVLNVDTEKVFFLRNGIFEVESILPTKIDKKWFSIVTAGRLSSYKHMDDIIKAFCLTSEHEKMMLYIIGDGEQKQQLQEIIESLKLQKHVVLVGAVPRSIVIGYFKSADIVLALGSINPMMEAMTCGVPVVTLNLGGTTEFVENNRNAIVIDDALPVTIKKAIERLHSNEVLRKQIGKNAKDDVSSTFPTWGERINQEISIVESTVRKYDEERISKKNI